jgi:hypothetical protein
MKTSAGFEISHLHLLTIQENPLFWYSCFHSMQKKI